MRGSTGSKTLKWLALAAMVSILVTQPAHAVKSVMTVPVSWKVTDLAYGLGRLRDTLLAESIRKDVEYVGAILEAQDGSYTFTQGNGRKSQDTVTFRIRRESGSRIVGFWHTHGDRGFARDYFSPEDAKLVQATGLPFYLITPEGEIRVLRRSQAKVLIPRVVAGVRLPVGSNPGEALTAAI